MLYLQNISLQGARKAFDEMNFVQIVFSAPKLTLDRMMRILSLSATIMAFVIAPAQAQAWTADSLVPQTEARDAAEAGRTVPFATISRQLRERYNGELVDAAMYSQEDGGYHYKVTWMAGDGKRLLIKVDALSGEVLHTRGG